MSIKHFLWPQPPSVLTAAKGRLRLWSRTAWVQTPALPLTSWLTLGKSLHSLCLGFLICTVGVSAS